jgi:hypothetical protein
MIDIVRPNNSPAELLQEVIFFVRAFGRDQDSHAIRTMLIANLAEAVGYKVESGRPTNLVFSLEWVVAIPAYHRGG